MNLSYPPSRTIALMDSHPLTLSGLSALIKSVDATCDIRITEPSLGKISEALMYQSVDVLVTDLQSTEENPHEGLDILLRLGAQFPDLNVVVYTFCHDSNALRQLLNQQNFSVIARGESMSDTEDFFKKAFVQKRILSPKICSNLARINQNNESVTSRLTRSEIDVLKHLFNGMDLQQIAGMKQLSIKTISAHKCNAMRKLGVLSDSELFVLLKNIFDERMVRHDECGDREAASI